MIHETQLRRPIRADGKPYSDYTRAVCSCGWEGTARPTRQVEGYRIAERDGREHVQAAERATSAQS